MFVNAAVRDGTVGSKLKRILEALQPEAAYFSEQNKVAVAHQVPWLARWRQESAVDASLCRRTPRVGGYRRV